MSWNIQKPGDYINGPLTVTGAATLQNDLSLSGNENYLYLFSNYSVGSNSRVRFRAVGAGGGSGYGGDFRVSTRASNNVWNTDVFTLDNSGRLIRGGASADALTTDLATMVNIGNFAVQNAASTGTLIAIKPDVANQNVNINVDARSGGIPDLRFLFGSVEKFRMTATGNINFQSGGGVNFGATTDASGMTSETLNDYEEGTFTPTIEGTSTAGTATYTAQVGRYTKIGRLVSISIRVAYSAGNGTGNLRVAGLPFATGSGNVWTVYAENIAMTAGNSAAASSGSGVSTISIDQLPAGGGAAASVPYDGAGDIQISGTYIV